MAFVVLALVDVEVTVVGIKTGAGLYVVDMVVVGALVGSGGQ